MNNFEYFFQSFILTHICPHTLPAFLHCHTVKVPIPEGLELDTWISSEEKVLDERGSVLDAFVDTIAFDEFAQGEIFVCIFCQCAN